MKIATPMAIVTHIEATRLDNTSLPSFIGVVGLGVVKAGNMAPLEDSERVIIALTDILSKNGFLAAVLGGVILAGILAATMSTAAGDHAG